MSYSELKDELARLNAETFEIVDALSLEQDMQAAACTSSASTSCASCSTSCSSCCNCSCSSCG